MIWAEKKNGTTGPVGAQILSMSQLLGRKWNSEKAIATGTHNKPAPSGCWRRDPALAKHIPQDDCRSMIGNTTIVATNTIVQGAEFKHAGFAYLPLNVEISAKIPLRDFLVQCQGTDLVGLC